MFFFKNNKQFDYRCIDLNLCIYSLEHQKQFWCSDILQFNSSHVSWIIFVTKQIYVLIGTCVDFIRSYRCSWNKDIHQFGWRISKMVGSKKQDFWPKIIILLGNHCISWIRGMPVRQKSGMILENKVVQKLKLEKNAFY